MKMKLGLMLIILTVSGLYAEEEEKLLDSKEAIIESYVVLMEKTTEQLLTIENLQTARKAFEEIKKLDSQAELILKSDKKLGLNIDYGRLDDKENKDPLSRKRLIHCQHKYYNKMMKLKTDEETIRYIDQNMKLFFKRFP